MGNEVHKLDAMKAISDSSEDEGGLEEFTGSCETIEDLLQKEIDLNKQEPDSILLADHYEDVKANIEKARECMDTIVCPGMQQAAYDSVTLAIQAAKDKLSDIRVILTKEVTRRRLLASARRAGATSISDLLR